MSSIKLNKMKIIQHVAAWMVFVIIQFIQFNAFNPLPETLNNNSKYIAFFFSNTLLILFYYLNYYYAFPKLLFNNKKLSYVIFACFYLSLFFLLFLNFPDYIIITEKVARHPFLFLIIFIVIRLILIFFVSYTFYNQKRKIEEEKNNLKNEIYSLRSQINPHFLFNTLNNIYALSLIKSDLAGESIIKLSSIMRYMIKEQLNDLIPIRNEIDYINSYIELEKLRLPNTVNLDINFEGDFNRNKIAPLIFLPFIENVFKHGVSSEESSIVKIKITVSDDTFWLLVQNTKVKTSIKEFSGFGINNVKKRLNLIYPNNHELEIRNEDASYIVNLKLNLHA
jgi:hypothetical protein